MLAFAIWARQPLALAVPVMVHLATDARMPGRRLTIRFGHPVNRCANGLADATCLLMHAYPMARLRRSGSRKKQSAAVTRTL